MSSPKEIARRRLNRSKIMKLPLKDFNAIPAERNVVINPHTRAQKKPLHEVHVKDHGQTNPFQVQRGRDMDKQRHNIKRQMKPETFIMDDVKTVCDIHSLFYKVIEGRPVRSRFDHKEYITQLRTILLCKADAGYARDQILYIDEATKCDEIGNWNTILHNLKEARTYFLLFLQLDFETAEHWRKKVEYMAKRLNEVNDDYATIAYEYAKLKNEVLATCIKFESLSIYGNFLQKVAPPWWRVKYDKNYVEEGGFFKNLFLDEQLSHEDIIEAVSDNLKINYLYFDTPDQLRMLLDDMANQCVTYMKIHVMSTEALNPIFTARTELKAQLKFEAEGLQYLTNKLENHIAYWEKREQEYQDQFYKILKIEIFKLYGSLTVCKLMTCVQFVYSTVLYDKDDPRDSVIDLMGFIEKEYERLRYNLDCLDVEVVKKTTAEIMAKDIITMQRAEKSQRTVKEWNIMRKALRASFKPPKL